MMVDRVIKPCFNFFVKRRNKLLQTFGVVCLFFAGSAQAALITASPGTDYSTAQDITDFYWSGSPDIGDMTTNTSTSIPHVTIDAMGGDVSGFNWYSFTIAGSSLTPAALSTVILDIDYGRGARPNDPGSVDLMVGLYDSDGYVLIFNDTSAIAYGQGGSINKQDSYIETAQLAGTYYVAVGAKGTVFADNWSVTGGANSPIAIGDTYQLQLSASTIPIPAAVWFFVSGLSLLGWFRRKV
jgi:hypothetical protein